LKSRIVRASVRLRKLAYQ